MFRSDRNYGKTKRVGGVLLIVPDLLNPEVRHDLNIWNTKQFERVCLDCSVNKDPNRKNQLINISCNPQKSLHPALMGESSDNREPAFC